MPDSQQSSEGNEDLVPRDSEATPSPEQSDAPNSCERHLGGSVIPPTPDPTLPPMGQAEAELDLEKTIVPSSDSLDSKIKVVFRGALDAYRDEFRPQDLRGCDFFGYKLTEPRGHGSQGVVFEAWQNNVPQKVAIKIAHAGKSIDHLRQEVKFCAELNQIPGVVKVLNVLEHNNNICMVMEWLEGETLEESIESLLLKRGNSPPFEWQEAFRIIAKVLNTVDYVHKKGVVHLDIKPSNIFLTAFDEVKLLDFGLSVYLDLIPDHPERIMGRGTPNYVAPELFKLGDANFRPDGKLCDIYSVGATLYRMLTGSHPFPDSEKLSQLLARAHQPKPPPDPCDVAHDLPPGCGEIVQKAMAFAPEGRYRSVREFRDDLEKAINADVQPRTSDWPERQPSRSFLRSGTGFGIGVFGLLAVGLIAFVWNQFYSNPKAHIASVPSHPHEGRIDLVVQRKGVDGKLRAVRLNTAGALPLRKGDLFRIEGRVNPPAYLYVLWLDPDHDVTPVYPWDATKGWGSRPAKEVPRTTLRIPEDARTPWFKAPNAKPGVATMVLIARSEPFDVSDDIIRSWFEELPELPLPPDGEQGAVWFDNFVEVREPDRARRFELAEAVDPFAQWQSQLQKLLGDKVGFQTSVSFARTGAEMKEQ